MNNNAPTSKVFYRPIEASIRWAGLLRFEQVILASISSPRDLPLSLDCPRWGELRLYTDRIYDGILNGELPFGQNGITTRDTALIDAPDLTVRHVDLKRWMHEHYPEQRPGFLFSRSERIAHPFISLETGQAMLVERLALKSALEQCKRTARQARRATQAVHGDSCMRPVPDQRPCRGHLPAHHRHDAGTDARSIPVGHTVLQLQQPGSHRYRDDRASRRTHGHYRSHATSQVCAGPPQATVRRLLIFASPYLRSRKPHLRWSGTEADI